MSPDRTYLFLHIMKTGGTSFFQHIIDNFAPEQIEPAPGTQQGDASPGVYGSLQRLRDLSPERRQEIRVYAGHVPYLATDIVQPDVTLTILRDPVDRAISMLRQAQRGPQGRGGEASLEEVYDTGWVRPQLIQDYLSKLFAMTEADLRRAVELVEKYQTGGAPETAADLAHLNGIAMDGTRLEEAKANLERVDVVGLQDRYGEFLDEVATRYGWTFKKEYRRREAPERSDAPGSLRSRIEADNEIDLELYRFAVELQARRRS